jgi:hypothetical protein
MPLSEFHVSVTGASTKTFDALAVSVVGVLTTKGTMVVWFKLREPLPHDRVNG